MAHRVCIYIWCVCVCVCLCVHVCVCVRVSVCNCMCHSGVLFLVRVCMSVFAYCSTGRRAKALEQRLQTRGLPPAATPPTTTRLSQWEGSTNTYVCTNVCIYVSSHVYIHLRVHVSVNAYLHLCKIYICTNEYMS